MKAFWGTVVGIIFILSSFLGYAAGTKIGIVDFEKTFNEYHRTKEEDAKLKAQLEKDKTTRDKLAQEINKMKDDLEKLGDEERKKKEEEIREKVKKLNEFQKKAVEDLKDKQRSLWLSIYGDVKSTVKEYAQKNGYTIILDSKAVVYSEGMDITEEIIKTLNKGK